MITVLKSKIHRATVTGTDLEYEGSIGIDAALLEKAGLWPYEQVQVANLNTGARFVTYVMKEPAGSGHVALNGGAARLGRSGDLVIIMAYGIMTADEAERYTPRVVRVDAGNHLL